MAEPVVIDLVAAEADEVSCRDAVLHVFPDICPNHLTQLALRYDDQPDAIISSILDGQEKGQKYPTRPRDNPLKRKREDDGVVSDEDGDNNGRNLKEPEATTAIRSEIAKPDYVPNFSDRRYREMAKTLLCQDFPRIPVKSIWLILEDKRSLFETYAFMDEATRNWDERNHPWRPKKVSSKSQDIYQPGRIEHLNMDGYTREEKAAVAEFRAARELRAHKDYKAAAEDDEKANFAEAQRNGLTAECGCCYDEQALNRMARCNGERAHLFCGNCVRQHAETQVGYSKYELKCLSMDGCFAGFSFAERKRFLDKSLRTALDRIEQEAVLREAGIEDLETCPFCPYAAEYPPADQDKEFRCERPGCRKVSCRLCRKETHIPKSCAEAAAAEEGHTARREIEEAMSDALIRKCNKCQNPFVKEAGCNKITCTRCGTIQCYVCRQTVRDYSHFNDTTRGGKSGQCSLFDESVEQRHQDEVHQAEEMARQKVTQERPDVDGAALRFKLSKKVEEDDKKRKERGQGEYRMMLGRHVPPLPRGRRPQIPQPGQIPAPPAVPAPAPAPAPPGRPGPRVAPNPAPVPLLIQHPNHPVYPPLPIIPPPRYRQNRSIIPPAAGPFGNQQVAAGWSPAGLDPHPAQPNPNPRHGREPNPQLRGWPSIYDLDVDGLDQMEAHERNGRVQRPVQAQFDRDIPFRGNFEQEHPENVRDYHIDAHENLRNLIWQRFPYFNDPVLAPPMNPALDPMHGNRAQAADALAAGNAEANRSPSVPS